MVKKFAALAAGVAMLSIGVMPVFAQTSGTSTTEVDVNDNMTLTVTQDGGQIPFGTGATARDFTPTSSTISEKFRATTKTTLVMTTNSFDGGIISADGTANNGVLTRSGGGTVSNVGGGANLDATCTADQFNDNAFTGLATRVNNAGTNAAFIYAATTIAAKYGAGTNDATSLWCHFDATDRGVAKTASYNEAATNLVMDYLVGVKAGAQPAGTYAETITFTATVN